MNIKKPSVLAIFSVIPCAIAVINNSFADTCDGKGWYRWEETSTSKDWCMPCPAGCYCDEDAEKKKIFTGGSKWRDCAKNLDDYGIYYCGNGYTSDSTTDMCKGLGAQSYCRGPQSSSYCYFKSTDTQKKLYRGSLSIKCDPGTYTKSKHEKCQPCKTGYICPGGVFYTDKKNARAEINSQWSSSWKLEKITLTRSPTGDDGIYLCPSGKIANADHSKCVDKNNSSNNNDNNKPSQKINCKAGTYLPMGGKSINDCKSCLDGYYCPGGTFEIKSIDQGLKSCAYDQKPNTNRTACISARTHCDKGYFLPANSSICEKCVSSDYVCFGGDFTPGQNTNQGQSKCDSYQVPNDDKTYCIDKSSVNTYCNAGQYLPANSTKCERCPSTKHYCIGGEFKYESFDQGIYDCPMSSVANDRRDSCVLTLSQDFMKYGPNGSNVSIDEQCWTKKTDTAYKNCIFNTTVSHSKSHFATKIQPITTPLLNNLQNNRSVPEILLKEKPVRKEIIKIEKGSLEQALIDSAKK